MISVNTNGSIWRISVLKDGKEKQLPVEQCSPEEFESPSESAVAYWAHYGYDRHHFMKDDA